MNVIVVDYFRKHGGVEFLLPLGKPDGEDLGAYIVTLCRGPFGTTGCIARNIRNETGVPVTARDVYWAAVFYTLRND